MRISDVKLGYSDEQPAVGQPTRVIVVTAPPGVPDKTRVAAGMAIALEEQGRRVLLVDADLGNASVHTELGLEVHGTLQDVLDGEMDLAAVVHRCDGGLHVIPARPGCDNHSNPDHLLCAGLVHAFSDIDTEFDTVVIDSSAGLAGCTASFCAAASDVLVVTDTEKTVMQDSVALITELAASGQITGFRIAFTGTACAADTLRAWEGMSRYFPDMERVALSCEGFLPDAREPGFRSACRALAGRVSRWPRTTVAGGHVQFFVERLINKQKAEMEGQHER